MAKGSTRLILEELFPKDTILNLVTSEVEEHLHKIKDAFNGHAVELKDLVWTDKGIIVKVYVDVESKK